MLVFPAAALAGLVHWLVYKTEHYSPIWVVIVPLLCLWASERIRSTRVRYWLQNELTLTRQTMTHQLQDVWEEFQGWKGHIGFLKTNMGIPIVVKGRPLGFLVAMRLGDAHPLIYPLDERTGFLEGSGLTAWANKIAGSNSYAVNAGPGINNSSSYGEMLLLRQGDWAYAGSTSLGGALQLLDQVQRVFTH